VYKLTLWEEFPVYKSGFTGCAGNLKGDKEILKL
jgi:hypothetical protein